jgi:hypothetical protein
MLFQVGSEQRFTAFIVQEVCKDSPPRLVIKRVPETGYGLEIGLVYGGRCWTLKSRGREKGTGEKGP